MTVEVCAPLHWWAEELLFDMDGTLVDSVLAAEAAWGTWARELGFELPDFGPFHGRTAVAIISEFVTPDRVPSSLERMNALEVETAGLARPTAGALELVSSLPDGSWAVVTSATRVVAEARLTGIGIRVSERFVTGDAVTAGKPDPEPYLMGRLTDGPERAVAFEDTAVGLRSARAAGCRTVGIVGTETAESLAPFADAVVESLADVRVAEVGERGVRLEIDSVAGPSVASTGR
ncbi:HAD-IA family hydrolase [Leucobacter sp. CSA1]|uniref:HAD-IA family hydrolase n=1 Tax=Leucobacter chromiisoli TaxID=2796471 RepID=A0A934UU25_9MICO|nr:HAD-IA family hydrolase [Leucobacter chromiisoli]MBK0418370.1 HAD-IA family hydrolase [Leucobacter chromiisoli]